MESCDTNVLLYYMNAECPEHERARAYMTRKFDDEDFAICELVLLEFYVLLRSTAVLDKPLGAAAALETINKFRGNPSWRLIDYPGGLMQDVWQASGERSLSRYAIYDARLAYTLRHHGINRFATRNVKDFKRYDFLELHNPIDD